jgi:CRISPR-associated protein Cas5 subtype I-B
VKAGQEQQFSTFGRFYSVEYALIKVHGALNPENLGSYLDNEEIRTKFKECKNQIFQCLWNGANELVTRSKFPQRSILYIEITYKDTIYNDLPDLVEEREELKKRTSTLGTSPFNFDKLVSMIEKRKDKIDKIRVKPCPEISADIEGLITRVKSIQHEPKLIELIVGGRFAAFRDPSVTSNQTVYHVPSKSAVIGLLGAMIGIQRDDSSLGSLYGSKYMDFFSKTNIGIRYEAEPRKITFFTNHRSFEKATMKPFKEELLQNPQYRIFVLINDECEEFNRIQESIYGNTFVYSPYLGHAYCPAVVSEPKEHETKEISPEDEITTCVILDESDMHKTDSMFRLLPRREDASVRLERHLHHYYNTNHLEGRVLKYWIPINFSTYRIERYDAGKLSKFYRIDDEVVCMF